MKHLTRIIRSLAVLTAAGSLMISCSLQGNDDYKLYTDTDEIIASPKAGEYRIAVRSNYSAWEASLSSGQSWISIKETRDGTNEDYITVTVEENTSDEDRLAIVNVRAGSEVVSVQVIQKSADLYELDFTYANNYYGDYYSNGAGYVEIDLRGGSLDNSGNPAGASQVVKLALFTEMADDPQRAQITDGTYTLGSRDQGTVGTFFTDDDASGLWIYDSNTNAIHRQLTGESKVKVTHKSEDNYVITGTFVTEDGGVSEWYYDGYIKLVNATNLTEDAEGYTIMRYADGALKLASFQGDVDGYRAQQGSMKFVMDVRTNASEAIGFNLSFYAATKSDLQYPGPEYCEIVGEYEFSTTPGAAFTLEEGYMLNNSVPFGSFLYYTSGVKVITHMITGGKMTIERYGNGEYDVKLDLMGKTGPDAEAESLGKYRYIGPLDFSDDTPGTYNIYSTMAVEASYVVSNIAREVARYDIYLNTNADSHYNVPVQYFRMALYSEPPRDENGEIILPADAADKGAISDITPGYYSPAYNSDYTSSSSGAEKFTFEMAHVDGFHPSGTVFVNTDVNASKTILVPYKGNIEVKKNEAENTYNIVIQKMAMYDYNTHVPTGLLNVNVTISID